MVVFQIRCAVNYVSRCFMKDGVVFQISMFSPSKCKEAHFKSILVNQIALLVQDNSPINPYSKSIFSVFSLHPSWRLVGSPDHPTISPRSVGALYLKHRSSGICHILRGNGKCISGRSQMS